MNALSELQNEAPYKDRFDFEIIPMDSPKGKASNDKYDWQKQGHGFVILAPDGKLRSILPGHGYGRDEIVAELDKALKP